MVVFHDFFGFFGFIFQIIYDLVPFLFFYKLLSGALNEEKFEKFSIISIICIYFNALIYFVSCAVIKENMDIMDLCNLQGSCLGIIYIIIYYYYFCFKKHEIKKLTFYIIVFSLILSSVIVIIVECIYLLKEKDVFLNIMNWVGVIFNIGEYLPIGFDFFHLIKVKKSEKSTLFGAIVGIINTAIWLSWSIIKTFTNIKLGDDEEKKYHSFIANIIGFLLCLSQIIVYCINKKDKEDNIDDNNNNNNNNNNKLIEDNVELIKLI